MPTTNDRIQAAQHAIDQHRDHKRDFNQSEEEQLVDLFTDLRHWARMNDVDFTTALRHSNAHFNDEQ